MYFIVWSDYDQNHDIMQFEDEEEKEVEKELAKLKALEDSDEDGTRIEMVIKGRELKYKTVEVTSKVKLTGE